MRRFNPRRELTVALLVFDASTQSTDVLWFESESAAKAEAERQLAEATEDGYVIACSVMRGVWTGANGPDHGDSTALVDASRTPESKAMARSTHGEGA